MRTLSMLYAAPKKQHPQHKPPQRHPLTTPHSLFGEAVGVVAAITTGLWLIFAFATQLGFHP